MWSYCPTKSSDESIAEELIYCPLKQLIIAGLPTVRMEDGCAYKCSGIEQQGNPRGS